MFCLIVFSVGKKDEQVLVITITALWCSLWDSLTACELCFLQMNLKWRWCSSLCSSHKHRTTLGLVQSKTLKMCECGCQVLTSNSVALQRHARVGLYWLLMWLPHEIERLISWRGSNTCLLTSKKYTSLHAKEQVRVVVQSELPLHAKWNCRACVAGEFNTEDCHFKLRKAFFHLVIS